MAPPQSHRPGLLKQVNKAHNPGRHRSKGEVKALNKGRVRVLKGIKKARKEATRLDRRNRAKQLRAIKEELSRKHLVGSSRGPPVSVCILSLSDEVDSGQVLCRLLSCQPSSSITESERGFTFLSMPKMNGRFCFLCPSAHRLLDVLDSMKIADLALFVWNGDDFVPKEHHCNLLSALLAQGIPSHYNVLVNPFEKRPKYEKAKRQLEAVAEKWSLPSKFYKIETEAEQRCLLRLMAGCTKKSSIMQECRTRMLVDRLSVAGNSEGTTCTAVLHGYVRGPSLDVNRLIHVPGWGDFQMKAIDLLLDPHPMHEHGGMTMDRVDNFAIADPTLQESLQSEAIRDEMDGEQTWPTEAELHLADEELTKRLVPKGTSEYQAAWIVDEGDEEQAKNECLDFFEPAVDIESESLCTGVVDMDGVTEGGDTELDDDTYDDKEEEETLKRIRQEREDRMFPDEIETPLDVPARVRFQRYRGLKSFRTSYWDPKENLPADYARIFQFKNFLVTRKHILKQDVKGAFHGWYVAVHVPNVPTAAIEAIKKSSRPLVVYGLLPYEQKMSVVNVLLRKSASCDQVIRSKDELLFCVGYRRYFVSPIFSQHTNGDKHKLERFMLSGGSVVASFFAPILFPPAGVSVFSVDSSGSLSLVATGSLMNVNANRIVIKRVVLSGFPYKINKHHAVVRYMFFNREDVDWFKPVELRTRSGRRGYIREALGTHGHMKCVFNMQLPSQDVVFLDLYKRVFPKWTYNPAVDQHLYGLRESNHPSDSMDTY